MKRRKKPQGTRKSTRKQRAKKNRHTLAHQVETEISGLEKHGRSHQLVVIVHAYTRTRAHLGDVKNLIQEQLPDADIYTPEYDSSLLSNANLVDQCQQLNEIIIELDRQRAERIGVAYEKIILIGHSVGALIVRKTFLFAHGMTHDTPLHRMGVVGTAKPWARRVDRILLFAGMNRGWELDGRPDYMSLPKYLLCRLLVLFSWTFSRWKARMILSVRRGEPFVVNMRLQWLELEQQMLVKGDDTVVSHMPLTIQFLGLKDRMVTRQDSIDMESGANFKYLKMPAAGHLNIIRFTPRRPRKRLIRLKEFFVGPWRTQETPADMHIRRRKFIEALKAAPDDIESDVQITKSEESEATHVVFIRHGIRDQGDSWMAEIQRHIDDISDKQALVDRSSYKYFPMLPFLFMFQRQKRVRDFADDYARISAANPNAIIGFIGHSNGTYIAASALERYGMIRIDHVVFANSVVPQDYDWNSRTRKFSGLHRPQVEQIQNVMGYCDFVVAIFPRLFEQIAVKAKWQVREIGSGGFKGFHDGVARNHERRIEGKHGAGIRPEIHRELAQFALCGRPSGILDGQPKVPGDLKEKLIRSNPCWLADFFWKYPLLGWLASVAVLIIIGLLIHWYVQPVANQWWAPFPEWVVVGYVCVVLLILLFY